MVSVRHPFEPFPSKPERPAKTFDIHDAQPAHVFRSTDGVPVNQGQTDSCDRLRPPEEVRAQLVNLLNDPRIKLEDRDQVSWDNRQHRVHQPQSFITVEKLSFALLQFCSYFI